MTEKAEFLFHLSFEMETQILNQTKDNLLLLRSRLTSLDKLNFTLARIKFKKNSRHLIINGSEALIN